MSIKQNILELRKYVPESTKLVCVSKFHPVSAIREAYDCGERIFGESRVQELIEKQPLLPTDIQWHFIGHLQSNKIKYIIEFVELIHGVDSFKLLKEIDKQAQKSGRRVKCLLQMHIAQEETKFGFLKEEVYEMLRSDDFKQLKNIEVAGLMGMATFTDNKQLIKSEFKELKTLFDLIKRDFFPSSKQFKEISMGMSNDYLTAIEEGSTIIRIGSAIFGNRQY
ncbi:MAG: YggS family pyridoxal phosphate-dependent enzyme [Paludibacteraceae bacterium]